MVGCKRTVAEFSILTLSESVVGGGKSATCGDPHTSLRRVKFCEKTASNKILGLFLGFFLFFLGFFMFRAKKGNMNGEGVKWKGLCDSFGILWRAG